MKEFLKATIVGGVLISPAGCSCASYSRSPHCDWRAGWCNRFRITFTSIGWWPASVSPTFLAVLLLIIVSFAAGIVARTNVGRRISQWFQSSFLGNLPQYQLVKSMAEGLAQIEGADNLKPALISVAAGWQIGYLLEPLENGWVAVFVPQAPTPMSGNVMYLPADRVRPLNISMIEARTIVKHIGIGSAAALRGTSLTRGPD